MVVWWCCVHDKLSLLCRPNEWKGLQYWLVDLTALFTNTNRGAMWSPGYNLTRYNISRSRNFSYIKWSTTWNVHGYYVVNHNIYYMLQLMHTVNIMEWYMQTNIAKAYYYLVVADVLARFHPRPCEDTWSIRIICYHSKSVHSKSTWDPSYLIIILKDSTYYTAPYQTSYNTRYINHANHSIIYTTKSAIFGYLYSWMRGLYLHEWCTTCHPRYLHACGTCVRIRGWYDMLTNLKLMVIGWTTISIYSRHTIHYDLRAGQPL